MLGAYALVEPSSASPFMARPDTPTEVVFACAEATIRSLKAHRGHWSDVATTRDVRTGRFETSQFKVKSRGTRIQIDYKAKSEMGRIRVKASGPYFAGLRVDEAGQQLAAGMARCL